MAKYFFLSEGWTVGRVWESGGLWNETAWRRQPYIEQRNLSIIDGDGDERLWLYQVEDAVLMVEVKPTHQQSPEAIGQVVLKRLMDSEKVIDILCANQAQPQSSRAAIGAESQS